MLSLFQEQDGGQPLKLPSLFFFLPARGFGLLPLIRFGLAGPLGSLVGRFGVLALLLFGLPCMFGLRPCRLRFPPLPGHQHKSRGGDQDDQRQQGRHRRPAPGPLDRPLHRPHRSSQDRLAGQEAAQVFGKGIGRGIAPARFLVQAFRQIVSRSGGTFGCSRPGGTGSWERTCSIVSILVSARKGGRPVSISYSTAP